MKRSHETFPLGDNIPFFMSVQKCKAGANVLLKGDTIISLGKQIGRCVQTTKTPLWGYPTAAFLMPLKGFLGLFTLLPFLWSLIHLKQGRVQMRNLRLQPRQPQTRQQMPS